MSHVICYECGSTEHHSGYGLAAGRGGMSNIREQVECGIALLDKMAIEELAEAYLAKDAELTALRQRHEALRKALKDIRKQLFLHHGTLTGFLATGQSDGELSDAIDSMNESMDLIDCALAADEGEVEPPDEQY